MSAGKRTAGASSNAAEVGTLVASIGATHRQEFANVSDWLNKHTQHLSCDSVATFERVCTALPHTPQTIVWLQSYPGEFSDAKLQRVRATTPGVEMACVYGALSEGELRTGNPVTEIPRFPWYLWEARVGRLPVLRNVDSPETATESASANRLATSPTIGVVSACRDLAEQLMLICDATGYQVVCFDSADSCRVPCDAMICDDSSDPRQTPLSARMIVAMDPGKSTASISTPKIALMNFPRIGDLQGLRQYGVRFVLGKPFQVEDLRRQLELILRAP